MSTINRTAHGLTAGQRVVFSSIVGGVPIDVDTVYFVLTAGLTANAFQISETQEGTPLTFTTMTSGSMQVVPETTDTDASNASYIAVTDPAVAMAPPTTPPTPTAPTVTSAIISGIVRLQVALNDTAEAKVRNWEIQITHKFDGSGNPDWTTPTKLTLPEGSTTVSIPALGSTIYNVRVSSTDVYGQVSGFSVLTSHTTLPGSDALAAALASLANDVSDGIITETKIADGAISTPKLQAGSVTAQVLAATIILASLIKTADTGRRIEMDADGIRLYDTDESLLVRIPTNGDPVFVKGQVSADSLVSQTAASFRTAVSIEGNAVATLQNGVSTPANVPSLTASVDSLTLGTAPSNPGGGIGYDSAAGTFWVACDPTVAPYYVAQEFNATTGALVRSLSATGSLTTVTATLGATSHVSDSAQGIDGSTNSHITTPLTIPAGLSNVKITKVSAYFAGHNGSCTARVGVWNTSNLALQTSPIFTASSGGATGTGNSIHYDKALTAPLAVTAGTTYRCGFFHTDTTQGFQFDRDDGSGKTTYSGDGASSDGTGWGTLNSASKPNVYITYTYDVDTRLETAKMIGVCTDGTNIYTLDVNGKVWKYNRTTLAFIASADQSANITGTLANAGLFYDATAALLIITTSTGTNSTAKMTFVKVTTALAYSATLNDTSGGVGGVNGAFDLLRGGARVNDPLNASAATYWGPSYSTLNGASGTFVNLVSNGDKVANRFFGTAATLKDGLTHDGTQFRGWAIATPTKVWKFSNWDWTTASAVYWIGYAWYDSNATGGTHETAVGPRTSITMRRRERVQVQNAAIATGGTDDPNNVRIYMLPGASDFAPGAAWLQVTDALAARYLTDYTASGTHDGAGTAFPAGVPAEIKSSIAGWSLKGDGSATFGKTHQGGTSFPASPATNDLYYRTDLRMEFFYDGTRWLSVTKYQMPSAVMEGQAVTGAGNRWVTPPLNGCSDIWFERIELAFFVSGGTALAAGTQQWIGVLDKAPANTNVTTFTINTGALSVWRKLAAIDLNVLLSASTQFQMQTTWTKTGTPGNLYSGFVLDYRLVAV